MSNQGQSRTGSAAEHRRFRLHWPGCRRTRLSMCTSMPRKKSKKAGGVYKPKRFNDHEYTTLRRLAEMIIPNDEHVGERCRRRRSGVHRSDRA